MNPNRRSGCQKAWSWSRLKCEAYSLKSYFSFRRSASARISSQHSLSCNGCGLWHTTFQLSASGQIEMTRSFGSNMVFAASFLINVSSCNIVFFGLLMRIYDYSDDLSRRRYLVDGWLDPAIGCWDKVVDRQPLNRRRPLEPQFPLAKEERLAKLSLASTPASPQTRPLESWSSAPPRIRLCESTTGHRRTLSVHRVNRNAYPRVTTGHPAKPSLSDQEWWAAQVNPLSFRANSALSEVSEAVSVGKFSIIAV
jgi:hypothetical protein